MGGPRCTRRLKGATWSSHSSSSSTAPMRHPRTRMGGPRCTGRFKGAIWSSHDFSLSTAPAYQSSACDNAARFLSSLEWFIKPYSYLPPSLPSLLPINTLSTDSQLSAKFSPYQSNRSIQVKPFPSSPPYSFQNLQGPGGPIPAINPTFPTQTGL